MNVFLGILVKAISSEMAKKLIGLAIKKLLEAKDDGVTKDVIKTVIDGAVQSKRNDLTMGSVISVKELLSN
jgi:hypothetical protein